MKLGNRLGSIVNTVKNGFRRFPATILVSTALVVMLILLIEQYSDLTLDVRDALTRICLILAMGIPISACINLILERRKEIKPIHKVLGYVIGAIFLLLYYFLLLDEINWISISKYIGVSVFLYLAFAFIPWIRKKEGYESYVIDVLSSFLLTMIYSFVLFLGIVIILFTINQLFDIDIPEKFTIYTFIIIGGIFAPSYFLARIPLVESESYKKDYPKALKVLLLYIVMPLITVYSLILYVYFLKILVTRNWPQGLVSHLVLWYSIVSVVVIFFITPILKDNRWAEKFKKLFPIFIIPILVMMFIAIGIRVNAYGLTENRYYGIVMGLWVTCIMIYFSFKRNQKNIIIPVSLAIVALISVFGPLSSFTVAKFSQNNRLESILKRNGMLQGNDIIAKSDISTEDKEEISMILRYFDSNHSLEDVKVLDEGFKLTDTDMKTVFGFPFTEKKLTDSSYFYIGTEYNLANVLEVKEFDYFVNSNALLGEDREIDNLTMSFSDNSVFRITEGDDLLYEKDLKDNVLNILESNNYMSKESQNMLSLEEATFTDENNNLQVKYIITSVSGQYDQLNGQYDIDYIECVMLIKIK